MFEPEPISETQKRINRVRERLTLIQNSDIDWTPIITSPKNSPQLTMKIDPILIPKRKI